MSTAPMFSLAMAMDDLVQSASAGKLRANDAGFVDRMSKRLTARVGKPIETVLSLGERRMLVQIWQRRRT